MQIKNTYLKKPIAIIIVGLGLIVISGGVTMAALSMTTTKDDKEAKTISNDPKQRADAANSDAEALVKETAKMGSGKEADKKTKEAAAKFDEASNQYKAAGNTGASLEADANADALASRLAAEADYKAKLEAEHAKQKAEQEAAAAAMSGKN